jgi:predicted heme/steroid binding protein
MIQTSPYNPLGQTLKEFTPEELARYDGSSLERPVYVAVDGEVFDVSANRRIYGKGGSYNMMYVSSPH